MGKIYNYKLAFIAKNRNEASVATGILESGNIAYRLKQSSFTESLSLVRGGASLPFEQWGIYVPEEEILNAKQALSEVMFDFKSPSHANNTALKVAKPFIWVILIIFFCSLFLGLGSMVYFILKNN